MQALPYPDEYIHYLAEYYGSRDFFECHEIMEAYWKENPDSPYTSCWLVLIRIPVALYHARRGNRAGAVKLMGKAAVEAVPELFDALGLDGKRLSEQLNEVARLWSEDADIRYADFELPFTDAALRAAAEHKCGTLGYTWGIGGLEAGDEVIHRHRTRDRSDVVAAREESARRKALSRALPNTDNRR